MNKFLTIKFITILVILSSVSLLQAATRPLVNGDDYEVMGAKGSKDRQVLEFFSYACGACYTMESFVTQFKKNNSDIKIIPVPTDLGHPQWKIYVKAYYLGELLNVLDKSHAKIFHKIHVEKRQITNDSALKQFFVDLGVDSDKYDKAEKSFTLNAKIRKAKQLNKKYRISGTPTFVANQRYKLNNKNLKSTEMIEKALKELSAVN